MGSVTIRRLSDEVLRRLESRAARSGRSTEAEIRLILEAAVRPVGKGIGSELAAFGEEVGGLDLERDRSPVEPARFE
ncbi:FitA-like ribbon-helix-helix domain-containing protein [Enterovirga rhinocerotis]|uniref:Plasmid stability protein n=1 Tax=Enterovirga rhinocerotis TaxID=1339210 RepID=A0A4V3DZ16_9HYPH|nr:plasmid stability protein [Enterovirga rhinocerotis]TDR94799.1 plasmid stability protein [Enterovirga rhinocerotis]